MPITAPITVPKPGTTEPIALPAIAADATPPSAAPAACPAHQPTPAPAATAADFPACSNFSDVVPVL